MPGTCLDQILSLCDALRMRRLFIAGALMGLGACDLADERESVASSGEPLVSTQGRESQGRESQGRESQGTSFSGNFDLRRYVLSTLRATFPEEVTSTVDEPRLVQGELQILRSLPSGSTTSFNPCGGKPGSGVSRTCGWVSSGLGRCLPGTNVRLAPQGICGGTCVGDPMMRVCEGTTPCEPSTAQVLGANDDACGGTCPTLKFTCPPSGRYNVMTAPSDIILSPVASVRLRASTGTYPVFNVSHGGPELKGAFIDAEFVDGSR